MADVNTQSCDECGILRKEANHWFRALVQGGMFTIAPWSNQLFFGTAKFAESKVLHLCSESCAVKAMCRAIGANG